jgi:hypothetical protein
MRSELRQVGLLSGAAREDALRTRSERLQALRSAWGVLASSGLSGEKQAIAESGRSLGNALAALLAGPLSTGDEAAIAALDARFEELEREMRGFALEVPIAQLRSTVPKRMRVDRRSVLDLMDLILGAEIDGLDGSRARLPALDYLITLLSTGGDPDAPMQDPVTLTHRLHSLCERAAADDHPRVPELEAEFYAAADMNEADIGKELELRGMRRRKMELGTTYFAPRLLRAIVTYNTALMRRVDEEALSSQDWGILPSAEAPDEGASIFETPALPKIAAALRRRTAGAPPTRDPLDRIAWCLDFTDLTPPEREALLSESTGRRENLEGTTILLGLLCRSAAVLDGEFPAVGIAPAALSGAWIQELAEALRQETNRRITDDYDGATRLSALKSKFLTPSSIAGRRSRGERAAPPPAPVHDDAAAAARKNATQLASAALGSMRKESATPGNRSRRWKQVAGALGVVVLFALAAANTIAWDEGRVGRAELMQVSPFLADGKRNANGAGTAFVGTLDVGWSELDASQQAEAADSLVQALRERGVREIMIYDDDRQLRIQALGSQPARVVR